MSRIWVCVLLVAALWGITAVASAHSLSAAVVRFETRNDQHLELMIKRPLVEGRAPALVVSGPVRCRVLGDPRVTSRSSGVVENWRFDCGPKGVNGARFEFAGLNPVMGEALVEYRSPGRPVWTGLVRRDQPALTLGQPGATATDLSAVGYLRLGVEHILSGFDHLLFVLALLLVVARRGWTELDHSAPIVRTVLLTVSAFTVAHSLTLAAAVLGGVTLPVAPTEIAIALSVLLLAVELADLGNRGTLVMRFPWLVAFGFGLLHGFGFAGALRQVGWPAAGVGRALLMFNLGVELGQLGVVAVAVALVLGVKRALPVGLARHRTWLETAAVYGIGTATAFWCWERSFGWAL